MSEIGGVFFFIFLLLFVVATPLGQLPYIEWGGIPISQSMAICRLMAREGGLAGNDAVEDAKIDMVVDHAGDIFNGERGSGQVRVDFYILIHVVHCIYSSSSFFLCV